MSNDPFDFTCIDFIRLDDEITKDIVPRCVDCEAELCAELDTYYGKQYGMGSYCSKCRRKYEVR